MSHFVFSRLFSERVAVNKSGAAKITGIYFMVIGIVFYFLWLSEIIPAAVHNKLPQSLVDTGLFTNGVQVLDLSFFLPGIFIIGLMLLQRSYLAYLMAPVILTFFVLMDITIAVLVIIMDIRGIERNLSVTVMMGLLDLFSLALLVWFLRENLELLKTGNANRKSINHHKYYENSNLQRPVL